MTRREQRLLFCTRLEMKIGALVYHVFRAPASDEHGMIVEIKEGNDKKYCKIQWLGGSSPKYTQWFPERELEIMSDGNINV